MDLEDWTSRFVFTVWVLALMTIPMQNIFPQVVKAVLLTLLVALTFDRWILNFLNVEAGYLDDHSIDWQDGFDPLNQSVVAIQFVLDTRS